MKELLRPAEWLLNRLTYPRKLVLVGLVFLLPLLFFGQQLVSAINADLAFDVRELQGVRYVHPLKSLMRSVQEHRGVSQLALHGDSAAPRQLQEIAGRIGREIAAIDRLDSQYGAIFGSSAEWQNLKAEWLALHGEATSLYDTESFTRHTTFVGNLHEHLLHLANASGLSLDPELATHYLIKIATERLTRLTESLGQTRGLSARTFSQKTISLTDRHRLAQVLGESARLRTQLLADLGTLLPLQPGLDRQLAIPLDEALQLTDHFLAATEQRLLHTMGTPEEARAIFGQGTLAIDAMYRLCEKLLPALQAAIEARARSLAWQKFFLLALGGAALLLALYLFLAFTHALIRQMKVLGRSAQAVSDGRLETRIEPDSRDEMARIAGFFNKVVDDMHAQVKQVAASEKRLRESEKHIRVLFNSGNDPILVYEADSLSGAPLGCFVEVNDVACYRLGYSREELLQMNPDDIIAHDVLQRPPPYIKLAYQREAVYESAHLTRGGKVIPVEINAHLFELYDRALVFAMARDISERRQAEEKRDIENTLARQIIERQMLRHTFTDDHVRYWFQPAENFSGDVIASARSGDGILYALLADATGHGLAAAITVVPVLTLFYRLVERGRSLADIAHALNQELRQTMPSGRFVAASLVAIDEANGSAALWHGGMPDILHLDGAGRRKACYASPHVPLGIVDFDDDMARLRQIAITAGDRLILFSDGLLEAANAAGEAFGNERIEAALQSCKTPDEQVAALQAALQAHTGAALPHDDVSLLLIDCGGPAVSPGPAGSQCPT